MKYNVKNVVPANWQDKKYFKATLENEAGEIFENIAFWNNEINDLSIHVEGELTKNDKGYWKFVAPKTETSGRKPNMERLMDKKGGMIGEAQEKKAENIAKAQDRTAWIHAKNGALELYMHLNPSATNMDGNDQALSAINGLANKIYHMEPTPFQ